MPHGAHANGCRPAPAPAAALGALPFACPQVPQLYKRLKYPFQISKSNLTAVGSPHTWPSLLVRAAGAPARAAWESCCRGAAGGGGGAVAGGERSGLQHGSPAWRWKNMQAAHRHGSLAPTPAAAAGTPSPPAGGADVAGGAAQLCGARGAGAAGVFLFAV